MERLDPRGRRGGRRPLATVGARSIRRRLPPRRCRPRSGPADRARGASPSARPCDVGGAPPLADPYGGGRARSPGLSGRRLEPRVSGLLRKRTFLEQREPRSRYDVVVIGGGVNGLAIAYNLAARHGIKDVAVFEAAYIGSGASGRNTQVIRANYNTPENVPLYKESLGIWRSLSAELDFNILFSTQGELDLCHTRDALDVEKDKVLLNQAYGVETVILTPEEIEKENPLVDVSGGGELPVIGAASHTHGGCCG